MSLMRTLGLATGLLSVAPATALAVDPVIAASATPSPVPGPPPPPYSLPWQLRPAAPGTALRSDTSVAMFKTKNMAGEESTGSTVATTFLASYKLTPSLAPLVRFAFVRNNEPGATLGVGSSFVNPILGLTWGVKLPQNFRVAGFGAATLPIGMGGDKKAGVDETAMATSRGIAARSAMDNAMFAVNYFTLIGGADLAYVANKLTVQAEVTVLQLMRARHKDVSPDSSNTNFTAGLHAGYFLAGWMSLSGEIRHQRWLTTPTPVKMNSAARDTTTFAVGPRFHAKLTPTTWIRPGISYSRGIDNPLTDSKYNIVQVDVPVTF